MHLDAYRMALANGKRPPKGMVIAPLTPRLHPLTPHQLLEVSVCMFWFVMTRIGSAMAFSGGQPT